MHLLARVEHHFIGDAVGDNGVYVRADPARVFTDLLRSPVETVTYSLAFDHNSAVGWVTKQRSEQGNVLVPPLHRNLR